MPTEQNTNSPPLADIRFPNIGVNDAGVIVKMDTQVIGLRIANRQSALAQVARGEVGEVVFTLRGLLHRFQVVFLAYKENILLLSVGNVLRGPQLRKTDRIEMVIHVSWRTFRSDGSSGAWYSGLTQDISTTGVKLLIPTIQDIPQEIEALLYLSEEVVGNIENELNQLNHMRSSAPTEPPIKIRGRVRHYTSLPDTRIALGILFTRLSDVDRIRIQKYLFDSQSPKRNVEREGVNAS